MTLGWIANILIVLAIYQMGFKKRSAWLYSFLGNILWCWYAIELQLFDMLFIDAVALTLAARNWFLWRDNDTTKT